jgi:hypothetical protein
LVSGVSTKVVQPTPTAAVMTSLLLVHTQTVLAAFSRTPIRPLATRSTTEMDREKKAFVLGMVSCCPSRQLWARGSGNMAASPWTVANPKSSLRAFHSWCPLRGASSAISWPVVDGSGAGKENPPSSSQLDRPISKLERLVVVPEEPVMDLQEFHWLPCNMSVESTWLYFVDDMDVPRRDEFSDEFRDPGKLSGLAMAKERMQSTPPEFFTRVTKHVKLSTKYFLSFFIVLQTMCARPQLTPHLAPPMGVPSPSGF